MHADMQLPMSCLCHMFVSADNQVCHRSVYTASLSVWLTVHSTAGRTRKGTAEQHGISTVCANLKHTTNTQQLLTFLVGALAGEALALAAAGALALAVS